MLFQTLDNKQECYKIFCDGTLVDDYQVESLTHTWAPSHFSEAEDIQYAKFWCGGISLEEACPEHLQLRWKMVNKKARVFLKTFQSSKINLDEVCFYDLVPEKFLIEFYNVKNEITSFVFENYKKPKNYDFLKNLCFLLKGIESNELNIDMTNVDYSKQKVRESIKKVKKNNQRIIYNPWKTVTGRLTTEKNSFPILTLNKELRSVIKPKNDLFVELDFNSAELRVLLGLLEKEQPKEDIHAWVSEKIFKNKYDRDKTKKKVFAWLYNPKAKNKNLNEFLDRDKILEKYYVDGEVATPYGRVIVSDHDKAVNYLIQSTASDMLFESAIKINKHLQNKKSFITFCIHDSIVIDMAKEDKTAIKEITDQFSKTKFGDLKINLSIGQDFGKMRKVL